MLISKPHLGAVKMPWACPLTQAGRLTFVHRHPLLIGSKDVVFAIDSGQLVAFVQERGASFPTYLPRNCLEIKGVPNEILVGHDEKDGLEKLQNFLVHTYPNLKVGDSGDYVALELRISAPGGHPGQAMIPFQPGLAMGSVVSQEIIEKLQEYTKKQGEIEGLEGRVKGLEQRIQELDLRIESYKEQKGKSAEALLEVFEAQKKLVLGQIESVISKIREFKPSELPDFNSFIAHEVSPVDLAQSDYMIDQRGFDSIQYSSNYISFDDKQEVFRDKMAQAEQSGSVSGSYGGFFFEVSASHSWTRAAMDRVAQIKKESHARGVLVIHAVVTTRNVRCYRKLIFDKERLKSLKEKGEKKIHILSEAVMGGAFSAILTYHKASQGQRDSEQHVSDSTSHTEASASGSFFGFSAKGSGALASNHASSEEFDEMTSHSHRNITVEFVAQGAIPRLAGETVVEQTMKYVDQGLYQHRGVNSGVSSNSTEDRARYMKDAMKVILNEQRKVESVESSTIAHSPATVVAAYDDFSGQIRRDQFCGIPIGFGYTTIDIDRELEKIVAREKAESARKVQTGADLGSLEPRSDSVPKPLMPEQGGGD